MTINNQNIEQIVAEFKANPSFESLQALITAINQLSVDDKKVIMEDSEIKRGINTIQRNSYEDRIKKEIETAKEKGDTINAKKLSDYLKKWVQKGRPLKYG